MRTLQLDTLKLHRKETEHLVLFEDTIRFREKIFCEIVVKATASLQLERIISLIVCTSL